MNEPSGVRMEGVGLDASVISLEDPFQLAQEDVVEGLSRLLADREQTVRSLCVETAMLRRVAEGLRDHLRSALGELRDLKREMAIDVEDMDGLADPEEISHLDPDRDPALD